MSRTDDRRFVSKGWGFEDWIVNKPEYCGKVLFVKKGKKCSWHYHQKKDETFYLQSGELLVRWLAPHEVENCARDGWDDALMLRHAHTLVLRAGDSFHVPVGMRHQFEGVLDSVLIEFSTQHFETDSIRVIKGD